MIKKIYFFQVILIQHLIKPFYFNDKQFNFKILSIYIHKTNFLKQ